MFDRLLREVIRWAMRMLDADDWLVLAMSMYINARTVVRTVYGN